MALTDKQKLGMVRSIHTLIYIIMASSVIFILYAGITKYRGIYLTLSLILMAIEGLVFFGNGAKCPLTALAVEYGAEKGYAFDTFLPEKFTRYTFRFFGGLLFVGLVLLLVRR